MNESTFELLTAADPARDVPVALGDVETLLHRAAQDVTSYEVRLPDRRRRALVAVAAGIAVAAVTGATVAVLLHRPPARPTVPPVPPIPSPSVAVSCLERIAAGVQATPYDGGSGTYEYVRMNVVRGHSARADDGTMLLMTYHSETSVWLAADGAERHRTIVGPGEFEDEETAAYFRDHPDKLPVAGLHVFDMPLDALRHTTVPAANPVAMANAIAPPRENGPAQAIDGAADLTRERILDTTHRAALLRGLARTDGVTCAGEGVDPTGRKGIVVTAPIGKGPLPTPGDNGSELVLVDPATGEILGLGTLHGTVTTWREVYLERGFTDTRPETTQ